MAAAALIAIPCDLQTVGDQHRFGVRAGLLSAVMGRRRALVNSLRTQLIDDLGPGLVVEATAEDGTVKAVSIRGATEFALAVMFHPEYWAERDPTSHAILCAFAERKTLVTAAE